MSSQWRVWQSLKSLLSSLLNLRNHHLFICDLVIFSITPLLALLLRFDGHLVIAPYVLDLVRITILFLTVKLSLFWLFGVYKRYWRYASIEELCFLSVMMVVVIIVQSILFYSIHHISNFGVNNLPRSLPFIDGLLSYIFIGALRFSVRVLKRVQPENTFSPQQRVLIIGAGSAGVSLVQEMQRNPQLGFYPIAFIDDNPQKLYARIRGIPVVGDRHKIPNIVKSLNIQKAIVAMPTAAGQTIRELVHICKTAGIQFSTLPGIHEILNGRVRVDSIRDVRIEDLLRREPIETDILQVSEFLKGKKVVITGAGGSIGSELCRQIFRSRPAQMILIGHGENSVFNIQQELEQFVQLLKKNGVEQREIPYLTTYIIDIRCWERLKQVFEQLPPDVIFHAAAHKHVPLMELNSPEAITNNVLGTKNLLDLALEYNVKHFVMVSTDKVVNPTNIMGASKRVAEMLVLQTAKESGKPYVAVRFGNVLGSRGSVIPTFKKQIAAGGPVTVTHPEMRRYFMTIPEAVQLVLQASVLGRGGEVLMMNMGEPMKIVDLAKELIRLSGYEVNRDIEILFTGLRPGEKLIEELFIPGEEYEPTQHEKLFVVKNASRIIPKNLTATVEALCKAADENDASAIKLLLQQIVAGYTPETMSGSGKTSDLNSSSTATQSVNDLVFKLKRA
ncbi:NAD-dependent epimerase/dehydratase family protein [Scytonema sp. UIC 10036]|uniref:polysaccharide biosynthesis protein n=1 Tax=Scytonema sp. UIC 10036 TaxID=2304196 RepID=UPI0012DAAD8D|nr:nucleoside-diphosphate sugar epimerase/dehydratase [Scytonema sp. UIC 10036]MUG92470.1 NAD-dependent epimerase/dehydratase family protein [Scytonema sp. UIC 10036]